KNATTAEERAQAEREIQKARAAVKGQGWRGSVHRIETKIEKIINEQKNEQQNNTEGELSIDIESRNVGNKNKKTRIQVGQDDNRICYICGQFGHVVKKCPTNQKLREEKKKMRQAKK
ncbi:MAG: hypothetical protein EZS28_002092, partial [Streblomastix strix]